MRFILPVNILGKLNLLRAQYQTEKNINLDEQRSWLATPVWLGGTNIHDRSIQIQFMEKIRVVLKPNLLDECDIETPEQWAANLTASRAYIGAGLYVLSQIPANMMNRNNSVLYRLINDDLGITPANYLDEEDKETCILAAQRLITSSLSALDDANAALKKEGLTIFSEQEWRDFINFLNNTDIIHVKENPYKNYPVTSITKPLFGTAFSYTGATLGVLSGDIISRASPTMAPKQKLGIYLGGALLVLGTAGASGITVFAPVIAEKLITSLCTISLAHIFSTAMRILGQGVGVGVGMPFDIAYLLVWKACSLVGGYYTHQDTIPMITGTRIADGTAMINGIAVHLLTQDELPKDCVEHKIELKDGEVYINNELVELPKEGVQLPAQVIDELKQQLASRSRNAPLATINESDEDNEREQATTLGR